MQNMQKAAAETKERRLHQRIMAPEGALVARPGDYIGLPYDLSDISMGGMAFLYVNDQPLKLTDIQMDIYLDKDPQIVGLPVTVVADQKIEVYSQLIRRCGVRFGELTQDLWVQLQAFINGHAAKPE